MERKTNFNFIKIFVCVLITFYFHSTVFAQYRNINPNEKNTSSKDTVAKFVPPKKISVRYVTESDIDRNISLHHIDTNPNGIEIFHNLYKNYTVFQDLGNIGTPSRPLLFGSDREVGFRLCENPFQGYWMKPEDTKYYNTKTPYSDLFYAQGSTELLYLLARHSQNILPRWNFGADLQRITSLGFLEKQYTSLYNYQFFTRYVTKNKKYDIIANATWNKGVVQESGGILSDSVFQALSGANKKVTPNFNNSFTVSPQTRFKSRTGFVKQYWHFGKLEENITDEDTVYNMVSNSQISYSIKAEEISYIFENLSADTNSFLLPHQYYDITPTTFDSTYYGKIENRIAYDYFNSTGNQLRDSIRNFASFALTHDLIATSQIPYVRNYQNMIAEGRLESIDYKNYRMQNSIYGVYDFYGYNAGDFKLNGKSIYRLPAIDISLLVNEQLYKPDFNFLLNKTNQFIWDNQSTFVKTEVNQFGFGLATRKFRHNFKFNVNLYKLKNWVYVDENCLPAQSKDIISVTTAEFSKTFQFWKFYFEHYIIYQNSNNDVIRIPEFSGKIRYYFQSRFMKMKFQLGFDVFYNTAYYANGYNPASRLFYLQSERLVGNYPLIDPFMMGEIKRAAFFFKYENASQDLFNLYGYYYTPHYPISLASFRMGLRWRFYD